MKLPDPIDSIFNCSPTWKARFFGAPTVSGGMTSDEQLQILEQENAMESAA